MKLSKASQGKLLDAVANTGAGMHIDNAACDINSLDTEHPSSRRVKPPVGGDLDPDAVPAQSTKRQLDPTSEIDALPAKRARLTQTDVQQSGVEDGKAEQTDKVCQCSLTQVNH